ncbi:MAG: recombination regulator RecX [Sideroxyarcus sp.]|nr:recombination regulator RecX [Sideroxyarcus sp.]
MDSVHPECRAKRGVSKPVLSRVEGENGIPSPSGGGLGRGIVLSLRARALQCLARREYSRAELRAKLLPHVQTGEDFEQLPLVDLDALLDDLTARGWLSDARAATQLVHAKRSRFGTQRITHELRQRGIAEELIDAALLALKESELDAAREVWQRKFGTAPQDAKEKARQMRFMQSRGFSLEVISKLLKSAGLDEPQEC